MKMRRTILFASLFLAFRAPFGLALENDETIVVEWSTLSAVDAGGSAQRKILVRMEIEEGRPGLT
ncbi:MAG: hypothetical protein V1798_09800, partial [Pseudomonadota bacterium]